jgi:hypothetical protein
MFGVLCTAGRREGSRMIFVGDYTLSLVNVLLTISAIMLLLLVLMKLRDKDKKGGGHDKE